MKPINLIFAIAVGAGLLTLGISQETPRGQVHGHVARSENNRPLPKVSVTFTPVGPASEDADPDEDRSRTVRTDANGSFVAPRLPVGIYQVGVSARAHQMKPQRVVVEEGDRMNLDLTVTPGQPNLEAYFSQPVWLPSETPTLELSGFVLEPTVDLKIYRISEDDLTKAGDKQSFFQAFRGGETPYDFGDPVQSLAYKPVNRDVEGHFVEQVPLKGLAKGFYFVQMSTKDCKAQGYVNVTDTGLVTRSDDHKTVCFVSDLVTGKPLPGVSIFEVDAGVKRQVGTTDESGLLTVASEAVKDKTRSFVAEHDDSIAMSGVQRFPNENSGTIAVVTDRPVYRQGDLIQFKGIVRLLKGQDYALPSLGSPVAISISDPNGNHVADLTASTNAHGSFNGSWAGTTEMKPGPYEFDITAAGVATSQTVKVAAYRKPEFNVQVTPDAQTYTMGQNGHLKVKCLYYYGAPVVAAKAQLNVYRQPYWTPDPEFADQYSDSDDQQDSEHGYGAGEMVQTIEVQTDETGQVIADIPLRAAKDDQEDPSSGAPNDYTYTVQTNVRDAAGRSFDANSSFVVNQGDYALKLQTSQSYVKVGSDLDVAVATRFHGTDAKPAGGRKIHLSLLKHVYRENSPDTVNVLQEVDTVTDDKGNATAKLTAKQAGSLEIRATSTDDSGRPIAESADVFSESDAGDVSEDQRADQTLKISFDRNTYKVGDTTRVLVHAPLQAGFLLLSVDGDGIMSTQVLPIKDHAALADIVLTDAMLPNVTIHALCISSKQLVESSKRLNLDSTKRDLKINLTSDATKYKPGGSALVHLQTLDGQGRPVAAEVSLGVVDESIYAISKDSLNIARVFYPKRTDDVTTSYSFEPIYLDGGDKSPANIPVRRIFKDTATWQPTVETAADGQATVTVPLPENLTSWRVTAVGVTDATEVGKSTMNFRTWKPLMVRLDTPGFMVNGDSQNVVVGVTNDSDKDEDIKIGINAENANLDDAKPVVKHVLAGKQVEMSWHLTAKDSGPVQVTAYAQSSSNSDAVENHFSVVPRSPAMFESHGGAIADGQEQVFTLRDGADLRFGELRVQVSPSLLSQYAGSLDDLIDYPYGCVEQTVDRFVPSLIAQKVVKDFGLPAPKRLDQVPEIARQSLDRLATMQHGDGSWGWWTYDSGNPYMTYVALEGLRRADALGYSSSRIQIDEAVKWAGVEANPATHAGKDKLALRDSMALAVILARHGKSKEAHDALSNYDEKIATPVDTAMAALSYQLLGDTVDAKRCQDRLSSLARVEGRFISWSDRLRLPASYIYGWMDDTAATATIFGILTEINPKDPQLAHIAEYLMAAKGATGWSSTYATAQVLIGFDSYLEANKEAESSGQISVVLNGQELGTIAVDRHQVGPVEYRVPVLKLRAGTNTLAFRRTGSGASYYSATLGQYASTPVVKPIQGSMDVTVTRSYRLLKPGRNVDGKMDLVPSSQPVSSAQSGDVIQCELSVLNPTDRSYVFIEDPIPSNCHVTQETNLEEGSAWDFWYSGMQVLDDRIGIFSRDLPHGVSKLTYFMHAETPGLAHALPTQVSLMYGPDQRSYSVESPLEVR